MDSRLNKPLVFGLIAVALLLGVLLGFTSGIADRIFGGYLSAELIHALADLLL